MKKAIAIVLCLVLVLLLAGCGAKEIPSLEDVSQYSAEELSSFAKSVTQKDLLQSWGEAKNVNNLKLWAVPLDGGTKYVIVSLENGSIMSIDVSFPLFVTVAEVKNSVAKGLVGIENYTKDTSMLTVLPSEDAFGNPIPYEVGDLYYFQFDGMIMETFPAQINKPYSATHMGSLSEEEILELKDSLNKQLAGFIE